MVADALAPFVIGTHDVDHERVDPCFTQGGISAACVMLMCKM